MNMEQDGSVRLPLTASRGQIAQAIELVQRRSRAGVAEPMELATVVSDTLERADTCAQALAVDLAKLRPHGTFWPDARRAEEQVVTLVNVREDRILVQRGRPSTSEWNGRLGLSLYGGRAP